MILQGRLNGKPSLVSLDKTRFLSVQQVRGVLRSLAVFHGCWWVWLRRQEASTRNNSKETIMNVEDVETAFMIQRHVPFSSVKWSYGSMIKGYVKLMETTDHDDVTSALKTCVHTGRVYQHQHVVFDPVLTKSEIKTVTHGDAWINNLMFTSDNPQVVINNEENLSIFSYFLFLG